MQAPVSGQRDVVVPLSAGPHRPLLIADDNVDATDSLAAYLRLHGYLVPTAYDCGWALDMAERLRPSIIVLDIGMPGLSGVEVARSIRALPWGAAVTLVAVTGWGHDEDRRQTQDAGFDLHFTKPIDPDVLLRSIADAVNGSGAVRHSMR